MFLRKYARFVAPLLVAFQLLVIAPTLARAEFDCESSLVYLDPSKSVRELRDIKRFTMVAYNVENLVFHVGKFERTPKGRLKKKPTEPPVEKSLEKIQGVAKAINELNADFVV